MVVVVAGAVDGGGNVTIGGVTGPGTVGGGFGGAGVGPAFGSIVGPTFATTGTFVLSCRVELSNAKAPPRTNTADVAAAMITPGLRLLAAAGAAP
jgi:hypothetical protein